MCVWSRWRSYFTSGSSALYLFLYSAFYFYTKLDITKVGGCHSLTSTAWLKTLFDLSNFSREW